MYLFKREKGDVVIVVTFITVFVNFPTLAQCRCYGRPRHRPRNKAARRCDGFNGGSRDG